MLQEQVLPENNSINDRPSDNLHPESPVLCGGKGDAESQPIKRRGRTRLAAIPWPDESVGDIGDGDLESAKAAAKKRAAHQRKLDLQKIRRASDPEKAREQCRKYAAARRERDPGAHASYCREWRKNRPEEQKEKQKEEDRARLAKRYLENKEDHLAKCKEWYEKNKLKALAAAKQWAEDHPETRNAAVEKYNHKRRGLPIPPRPRPDMCELCHCPETRRNKKGELFKLCLDHCHETGGFRGWLCHRCNRTLGMVRDQQDLLINMAGYLIAYEYR